MWSPDGGRIYFRSRRGGEGSTAIYQIPAEGGTVELVAGSQAGGNPLPWAISADGSTLLLVDAPTLTDVNLATLDIENGGEAETLIDEEAVQFSEPSFSPNGEWMVYYEFPENDVGAAEINIRPFPNVRQQRRPVVPGIHPVFSADGSEIFFFDGGGLSVTPVEYAPFRVGNPQQLFRGLYWYGVGGPNGQFGRAWDVDPNNDRFLMITMPETAEGESGEQPRAQINVILNWFDELNQLVPRE